MIITVNILLPVMQKASALNDCRILEVCSPIDFTGESFRKSNAAESLKKAVSLLSM